ncbi:MAG TPA: cellulase family glycosylhydrolase, partial [Opitutaceae bacterium]|nr:cellulase family glycosylhydrolase [Opitutaceae bacterium]
TSALAAIGRRSDRFIAAWIWNRAGLRAPQEPAPVSGALELGPVPAGEWNVTWWDTLQGHPTTRTTINHPGGPLELPTPPVGREAAVVLVRRAADGAGPGRAEAGPRVGVRGNRFVTPDGEPVLFRGLCLADPDKLAREGRWNRALFAAVKGMGANLVRLPVHPSAWRSRTPDGYLKLLDEAVDWCGSLGLYVIIDWHSIGNLPAGMFQDPMYETTVPETLAFWRTTARHFRGRPTVAFYELFNEPTHFNGMLGPMSWTEWRNLNEEMIGVIRYWDRETIPLVAGFDWAYDLDPVRYEPVRAEGIGYVAHPYPDKRPRPWEPKWEEDFAFAADRYPMIATEIGFSLPAGGTVGDDDYGNRITRFLESRGIGWMAWVFDPDWRPQLLRSFDGFALTGSGEFFRQALQRAPAPPGTPPAPAAPAPSHFHP